MLCKIVVNGAYSFYSVRTKLGLVKSRSTLQSKPSRTHATVHVIGGYSTLPEDFVHLCYVFMNVMNTEFRH